MLFECSCEATAALIDEAIEHSIALSPKANTPLCELVKNTTISTVVDLTSKLDDNQKAIPMDIVLEESNNSMHNGWTNEIVERASDILNKRIDIIKTSVIPAIRSVSDAVLKDIAAANIHKNVPSIVRYTACDLINIDSFMNDVKRNTPGKYFEPDMFFEEESAALEYVMTLLKSGSDTVDIALGEALNRIGADNIFRMWESLFVDRTKISITNYLNFNDFVMNPDQGLDYAIIIYKLASTLESKNKAAASQYKEAAAVYITLFAKQYKAEIEAGKVIRSRFNNRGEIEVYSIPYTSFLQKGGTAEMIIGASTSDKVLLFINDILDNSKSILHSYKIVDTASSLDVRKKTRLVAINSLKTHFTNSFMNERSELEKAYYENNQGQESSVLRDFEKQLEYVNYESTQDLARKVTEIICNSRFKYVDCYDFLKLIDSLCTEGYEPADALVGATLQEISNFVVSQIKS